MSASQTITTTSSSDPRDILATGIEATAGQVSLACSFSVEDAVIIDLLQNLNLKARIFAIDTGRLHEETYEVAENLTARYGLEIDWYFPERAAVEKLEQQKGLFSFRKSLENRQECCHIRKVEPLQRALEGLSGWITGLRREQSLTRSNLQPIENDQTNGGLLKISPLLEWKEAQVWDYANRKCLPVNQLHKQGYPSIGCAPCTRAVQPGESTRAGRWWWENPEHKECGLHRRHCA
ncbi:MAG: phosphoadenylyl-sulfate reductase [Desulfuromonas sp.]|nr:MAG: phosphoadenylyl-sulfate reductase [Desulfuromonas sp.]